MTRVAMAFATACAVLLTANAQAAELKLLQNPPTR